MNAPASESPRWWQWPTILSLDAPVVAITWQCLFAALATVPIAWAETTVLGVSVWLAYMADRWFEGWRVAPDRIQTARHRFYQRRRWTVAGGWLLGLAGDLTIAFWQLTRRELIAGVVLLGPTLLYLLSHQLVHRHHRWRAPKEICIAILLAGGASVFVFATPGAPARALVGPVALFVALCFTNVALIAVWEQQVDETHGQDSLARQFGLGSIFSRLLPLGLTAIAALAGTRMAGNGAIAAHCVAASAILLALLDRIERRVGWRLARVLADLVLLTPLVPLFRR